MLYHTQGPAIDATLDSAPALKCRPWIYGRYAASRDLAGGYGRIFSSAASGIGLPTK